MAGGGLFVGREYETSRLLSALHGDAGSVLVIGDAGVGKTRLVAEAAARASAEGVLVLRGECLPVSGALPLFPIASALQDLASADHGSLLSAALQSAPAYVRTEITRLLPQLASGPEAGSGTYAEEMRQRMFAGVAELLAVTAAQADSRIGLVIEDVHWADSATLDFLTVLSRTRHSAAVTVVVTCRADEGTLPDYVTGWLTHIRSIPEAEELALGPMSRDEVARQAAALAGEPLPHQLIDELFARAEGSPFFTEQLVAAAQVSSATGTLQIPAELPSRLAGLLSARAGRCGDEAQTVMAALAVAGLPASEELLSRVTGLELRVIRSALRELRAASLLAADTSPVAYRARHALLAEAVAASLLPGDRATLHGRIAEALALDGDQAAAEVAAHWRAAGRTTEELAARRAAAEFSESVFGYAEAAMHWCRAIEICTVPSLAADDGSDLPRLYWRAIGALQLSDDRIRSAGLAYEACDRFASHPDPATRAIARHRAAMFQVDHAPQPALALMEESLRLFSQTQPSAEHAQALLQYTGFLTLSAARRRECFAVLQRALAVAEQAGAAELVPDILTQSAFEYFVAGQIEEGRSVLARAWALANAAADSPALMFVAIFRSALHVHLGQFESAVDEALRGIQDALRRGLGTSPRIASLEWNAVDGLLALGRTDAAAALIDHLTAEPPDGHHQERHHLRVEVDLLRGDIDAAQRRRRQLDELFGPVFSNIDSDRIFAEIAVDLALWAGRPSDALAEARRVLTRFSDSDLAFMCGRLLGLGMRACADLAEQARARQDQQSVSSASAAADGLTLWLDGVSGSPLTAHPLIVAMPAERASWEAERTRLAGVSDPQAWGRAAKAWQDLSCPHRAGYALWRQVQAELNAGQPGSAASSTLRDAYGAAHGHAPLLAQIRLLAEKARIQLTRPDATEVAQVPAGNGPYGLTPRELTVLRLVAAGLTNAQIGAELFMSPKTASVHVTSILRKLGVSGRVQAAILAERAGLLDEPEAKVGVGEI